MKKTLLVVFFLLFAAGAFAKEGIFVECESFSDPGGWVVDQQFMDKMGSPYLLAHGMGVAVKDASTVVNIPEKGTWNVYVRTYNWTSPWSTKDGPGRFQIKLGKKTLKAVLGTKGNAWEWQYAGSVKLAAGNVIPCCQAQAAERLS